MKKLTKTAYNKLVKAKILSTGLFNGQHVESAEVDDELYAHLDEIKQDFKSKHPLNPTVIPPFLIELMGRKSKALVIV